MANQASEDKRNSLNKSDIDVKLESIIRSCIDDPHDRTIGEAKKAILDWRSKQTEEVLDRLQGTGCSFEVEEYMDEYKNMVAIPLSALEAERNKLKESSNE